MTDRDRLAADLHEAIRETWHSDGEAAWERGLADRLIALGWTLRDGAYIGTVEPVIEWEIDEERLARALLRHYHAEPYDDIEHCMDDCAAAIAKAYREDADGG